MKEEFKKSRTLKMNNVKLQNNKSMISKEKIENENKVNSTNTLAAVFLYTIACCICALFFFVVVASSLFPKTAIKMFDNFGLKNASYAIYERNYERTGKLSDLYNLIQKSVELKKYSNVIKYSNEMLENENFSFFESNVNKKAIEKTDIEYAYLVYSYETFLKGILIRAYYNLGNEEKSMQLALACFDDNLFADQSTTSFEFNAYVDCVVADKEKSIEEKTQKLAELAEYNYNDATVMEWLAIEFLNAKEGAPDSGIEAIICLQIAKQICEVQIQLSLAVDSEADISSFEEERALLIEELETLWQNH